MSETVRPAHLPVERWLGDFEDLSAAEHALVAACAAGEFWTPDGWDEKRPETPTAENTIRAGLIRFLLLGGDAEHPVHEQGVMILGAWIRDVLNLSLARCDRQLALVQCYFEQTPNLRAAHLPELALSGSQVPGLSADSLTVTGGIFLRDSFLATGEVRLLGATIGGSLSCTDSTFRNEDGIALSADGLTVGGGLNLRDGFSATGAVRLLGARVEGNLDCSGGTFCNTGGDALSADRLPVSGDVILRNGFSAIGAVRLLGARVGGDLTCTDCTFQNENGVALSADGITVKGSGYLGSGLIAVARR